MKKKLLLCAAFIFTVIFAANPLSAHAADSVKDTNGKSVAAASADVKAARISGAAKTADRNGNIKVIDKRRYERSVYNDNRTFPDGFSFLFGLGIGSRWGERPWYRPRPFIQINNWWNYPWWEYALPWDYDPWWDDDPYWDDYTPWEDIDPWYDDGYYDPTGSDLDLIAPQSEAVDNSKEEEIIIVPQEELPSHMEYEYVPQNDPMFGPDSQPLPETMTGPEPMPGFEPTLGPEPMPELEDDYGGSDFDYGGWD